MDIKRALVPVDFSEASLTALDYAIDLLRPLGAEFLVVLVVEPLYFVGVADVYGMATNLDVQIEEQRRIGSEQLANLSGRLTERGVPHRTLLASGTAYRAIVEAAEEEKADIIVMATHGRTGVSHLLIGSVTEKVVRTAGCPVLTVRAPGKSTRR